MRYAIIFFVLVIVLPLRADTLSFDVASVRQNKSGAPPAGDAPSTNFPLGPGSVYVPNGGYFTAKNQPMIVYILFAYKVQGNQAQELLKQLPGWVMTDRFDIQARAAGNPTKDEMRLMMQSLLAERFHLSVRTETRVMPVYVLTLIKAGKPGPQLREHPIDSTCITEPPKPGEPAPPPEVDGGFPSLCGGILGMPPHKEGSIRLGARNARMSLVAEGLGQLGRLGRPVIDQTGMSGLVDFAIEFVPDVGSQLAGGAPDAQSDLPGTSFLDALTQQLGLKIESTKAPVEMLVAQGIEHPSEN
jgi:uncharacterized protein (TIGR03435 family)